MYLKTIAEVLGYLANRHPELASSIIHNDKSGLIGWSSQGFTVPCPPQIKHATLARHNIPHSLWIESGTLNGDTAYFLSKISERVITLEPHPELFEKAKHRFLDKESITVINEASETAFPRILKQLSGNICFWLDGHYSGDGTYAGPSDTPLLSELNAISNNLSNFSNVTVLIDDIRLCGTRHVYGDYPSLDELVDWVRSNNFDWTIEYDIFVAKLKRSDPSR
jgi:hypothetical protein